MIGEAKRDGKDMLIRGIKARDANALTCDERMYFEELRSLKIKRKETEDVTVVDQEAAKIQ